MAFKLKKKTGKWTLTLTNCLPQQGISSGVISMLYLWHNICLIVFKAHYILKHLRDFVPGTVKLASYL